MSTDPAQAASAPETGEAHEGQPSEEQLRAAYEAEISRVTSTDMILQAVVSLLNVGGHRLGLTAEGGATAAESSRDLEQVRDAIDGVRALLPILERREPESLRPLRDALSQLQMAYAREAAERARRRIRPALRLPRRQSRRLPRRGRSPRGRGRRNPAARLWVPGR